MKVTWGIENGSFENGTVATVGSYDGLHLGHLHILDRLRELQDELNAARSLIVTFHPHPQSVLRTDRQTQLLTTIEERLDLLSQEGIDEVLVIAFSTEFSRTPYAQFFHSVLRDQLGVTAMVVGHDHAFGKNREGDIEHLQSLATAAGVRIEEVPPFILDGVTISSTKIRKAIGSGDLELAQKMLGRPYAFTGSVISGDRLGRELGYPTANLEVPTEKLLPPEGIYAVSVSVDGVRYKGALSIGTRPTISDGGDRVVEVFLLDFSGDLYGKSLKIACHSWIRDQVRFENLDALRIAISEDVRRVADVIEIDSPV